MLKQFPWGDKSKRPFLTRTEEYVQGLEASVTIWKMANEGKITNEEAMAMRKQLNWPAGLELHLGVRGAGTWRSSCVHGGAGVADGLMRKGVAWDMLDPQAYIQP